MEYTAIVTVLVLLQFTWFGMQVGSMRVKHGVSAPAVSGAPEFDRCFRVHYNTMEQLVVFIPVLWLFGHTVNPLWGAGFGVVFLVGRFIYQSAYLKDPAGRSLGAGLSFLPGLVMMIWVLIKSVMALI